MYIVFQRAGAPSPLAQFMTIHPVPQDAPADSARATTYDSVWAGRDVVPTQQPEGFERIMLADGKIYVVLAVVLIIWFGLVAFLFRTDRKLDRLEQEIQDGPASRAE